jgi:hypothetical protein
MSDSDIILAGNGKPWKTKDQASAEIQRQKLDPAVFGPITHEGGWAIGNVKALQAAALPPPVSGPVVAPPAEKPVVQPIVRNDAAQFPDDAVQSSGVLASTVSQEAYFYVVFQEKSSEQDVDLIPLSINNDVIMVRRGEKIVLPQSYLEVADHSVFRKFKQVPGQPRKVETVVKRFPYSTIGPASRQDFVRMMTEGNAKRDVDIARMQAEAQGAAAVNANG